MSSGGGLGLSGWGSPHEGTLLLLPPDSLRFNPTLTNRACVLGRMNAWMKADVRDVMSALILNLLSSDRNR